MRKTWHRRNPSGCALAIDFLSHEPGFQHLGLHNLIGLAAIGQREDVLVDDDQVGGLAYLDGACFLVEVQVPRTVDRVGINGIADAHTFGRIERRLSWDAPRHGDGNIHEWAWITRVDWCVGAAQQRGPRRLERLDRVRVPFVQGAPDLAPEDRFFSYKHYLDGNGELIDPLILMIIAKAMIRNKPDSYCLSYDLRTTGISAMVHDLLSLYVQYGIDPSARIAYGNDAYNGQQKKGGGAMRRAFDKFFKK